MRRGSHTNNSPAIKGVPHLPNISIFCALSHNNQHLEEITHVSYSKLFKELKNGIEILVGQAVFKS